MDALKYFGMIVQERDKKMEKMQSIEPNIADLVNGWFKSYCLDYKFEQRSLNGFGKTDEKFPATDNSIFYYPIFKLVKKLKYENR